MFPCHQCKREFDSIPLIVRHLRTHFLSSSISCGHRDCFRKFSTINALKNHLYRCHKCPIDQGSTQSNNGEEIMTSYSEISEPIADSSELLPIDDFSSLLECHLSHLSARQYANPLIPRVTVQSVMDSVDNFFSFVCDGITSLMDGVFTDEVSRQKTKVIQNVLSTAQERMASFNSDFKRLKYFESKGTYIPPLEILLGTRWELDAKKRTYSSVPSTLQLIPLSLVFQNFLNMDTIFADCLKYYNYIKEFQVPIVNLMQGEVWRKLAAELELTQGDSGNVIHLPLILYYDDFEVNNPLGSHAGIQKLGGLYVSLPFLPPKYVSALNNIFILALFHASDRTKFGNKMVFSKAIDQLNFLSQVGVPVNSPVFQGIAKLHVIAMTGDNLGLNGMLGFVESFSANHFCRICDCSKRDIQTMFLEDSSRLRTLESYHENIALNDPSMTGIKEACTWFKLNKFHPYQTPVLDVLHDYLEGCCRYTMDFILKYLVQNSKLVTPAELESKLISFDYGPDRGSKPVNALIREGTSYRFKTSAAEMRVLVMYFGLIIGAQVPELDPVWELYILLRKLLVKLLSHRIFPSSLSYLSILIEDYIQTFCKLAKSNVKPKFHFLVHYPQMCLKFGPLTQFWTMRFEGKHKVSKMAARVSNNRINITKSLAIRNQLSLNYIFLKRGPPSFFETGKRTLLTNTSQVWIAFNSKYNTELQERSIYLVKWLVIEGIRLEVANVVTLDLCPVQFQPIFAKVENIIIDNNEIYVQYLLLETNYFDEHFYAFSVSLPVENSLSICPFSELYSSVPNTLTKIPSLGQTFITLRSPID